MPETPQADTVPETAPMQIEGQSLVIASPISIPEASFSVPAVRAMRSAKPETTLVIVATEEVAPIWRKVANVDQIIVYQSSDSPRKVARLLSGSGHSFDSAIAWDENPAALAFARINVRQRLGYPAGKLAKHLTDPVQVVRKIGPVEHQVKHYLLFVQALGIDPFQPANFEVPPRPPVGEYFRLAIVPGSDFGPAAEWGLPNFVALYQGLGAGCEVFILPCPGHSGPAKDLARELGNPGLFKDVEGDELIDLLASCEGLVGNDGSLPHLAALVGTPSLVLFGPNEPEWKRPLGKIHKILHHREACSSCLLAKCPLDHRCLTGITVDEALEALRLLFRS